MLVTCLLQAVKRLTPLFPATKNEYLSLDYVQKTSGNSPLFIKTIPTQDELKFHYTVHTSLDVVEEKVLSVAKNNADLRELYLGLLYPTEDYKVYGYVTNTKSKFIIIVESNTNLRDNDIRTMFRKLHTAYTDMICNPFYIPGENITSKSFANVVSGMLVEV